VDDLLVALLESLKDSLDRWEEAVDKAEKLAETRVLKTPRLINEVLAIQNGDIYSVNSTMKARGAVVKDRWEGVNPSTQYEANTPSTTVYLLVEYEPSDVREGLETVCSHLRECLRSLRGALREVDAQRKQVESLEKDVKRFRENADVQSTTRMAANRRADEAERKLATLTRELGEARVREILKED